MHSCSILLGSGEPSYTGNSRHTRLFSVGERGLGIDLFSPVLGSSSCEAHAAPHSFTLAWVSTRVRSWLVWLPDNKDRNKNRRAETDRRSPLLPFKWIFLWLSSTLADVCLLTPTSQMVVVSRVLDSHKIFIISQNRFIWQLHTFCCFVGRSMFREKCSKISLIFNHCPGPPSSSSVSTTFAAAWWRQSVVSWAGGSVCAPSKRKSPKW